MRRRLAPIVLLLLALPTTAGAQASGDGLYGRFDGDVFLSAGLGGGAAVHEDLGGLLIAELRARYLETAGLLLATEWQAPREATGAPGDTGLRRDKGPRWRLLTALEVRPLFPALFLTNNATGIEFIDLTLQSIGLELGLSLVPEEGAAELGLLTGFGLELPIVPPSTLADGIFLRLAAETRHQRQDEPPGTG